jgi:16S rRNA C1402 N4-methylase RsmH
MSLDNTTYHIPVLLEEAIAEMAIRPDGTYCDLTFGGGGHVLASGCQIHGEYEEVVDKLRYAVIQHLID